MRDEIIYCENLTQLKQELKDNGFVDEEGNYTHGNLTVPIKYNGEKSLTLVRNNKLDLSLFPSLTVLGSYDEIRDNPEKDELYKSVWDYTQVDTYTDEDGNTVEVPRQFKIGEFA